MRGGDNRSAFALRRYNMNDIEIVKMCIKTTCSKCRFFSAFPLYYDTEIEDFIHCRYVAYKEHPEEFSDDIKEVSNIEA